DPGCRQVTSPQGQLTRRPRSALETRLPCWSVRPVVTRATHFWDDRSARCQRPSTRQNGSMGEAPVSDEVAVALARFFYGGAGPSHPTISRIAAGAGYGDADPYSPATQTPNKQTRVHTVLTAA